MKKNFEAIVIGGGHAGIEAACALARKGHETLLVTISLNAIGFMPCNPNVGGTAKGHIVKEVDALGGVMGQVADQATIQTRMLNAGNGAAVHSLRNQVDKDKYHILMKRLVEKEPRLSVLEAEIVDLFVEDGKVSGVKTALGDVYTCRAIVLCTGVYLDSRIIIGDWTKNCGPAGYARSEGLSDALRRLGLPMRRFKTGTPMRVKKSTVDFSKTEPQYGDEGIYPFSEMTEDKVKNTAVCYLTYTNEQTHKIILDNLDRSPLYNGEIKSTGPRYCPSIETKVVRFSDKDRHQIFIEPESVEGEEMYVQGLSTSLPFDVQEKMLRSIPALRDAEIMRYGYAIEYDCLNCEVLLPSLAVKGFDGLYSAGQMNGSSGYEEAAGQGLIAGINAALYLEEKPPLILRRDQAYIGVLIDDLVTKGTEEPYRMMTSRAEYRLLLRQDNADFRLTEIGREIGLVDDKRYEKFLQKKEAERLLDAELDKRKYSPEQCREAFEKRCEPLPKGGVSAREILRRSTLDKETLCEIDEYFATVDPFALARLETDVKYEGYLKKQERSIKEMRKMEQKKLGPDFDYDAVDGLRLEAKEKLKSVRPMDLSQASRISGVNPADVVVLMVHLSKEKR
ncbi:MAG: tRNA uridine-5-carboxymethylaminomethyl(34) synthesis enzyme MnmG [Clostridia bacterium]|nr:tRNA uridine-5-carboxymethylaminomethyl(34) synthesis enzyme MnmG [Clostridia bacterium]